MSWRNEVLHKLRQAGATQVKEARGGQQTWQLNGARLILNPTRLPS